MSINVEPTQLHTELHGRSDGFVTSVGAAGQIKVMHCRIDLAKSAVDGVVRVELGPGGLRNLNERPSATLVFPEVREGFSLLADGEASPADVPDTGRGWMSITINAAVLHKAPDNTASC